MRGDSIVNIRKAIIPAAGLGTRFLPATKAQPKEMLPIVDKPTIQYIVEEAVRSGIEDIMIISGRGKRAIEDHFDKSYELEEELSKREKWDMLEGIQRISNLANIHYIRQREPKGLGDAIHRAKTFVGDEPFAVLLGDDIIDSDVPVLSQLMDVYQTYECPVIGVQAVPEGDVSKYGILHPREYESGQTVIPIRSLVEKPSVQEAPSNLAIMGRYILTPNIFNVLASLAPGAGGEIQLTDALSQLSEQHEMVGYLFEGNRYDVGDKIGFLKANLDYALRREELREPLLAYIKELVRNQ
nr:UTP--glucose-1-phosphate uridylyltransferase GalU [Priestia koreensis]